MSAIQSSAVIPLSEGRRKAVQFGCICMMLSVAMYGLALSTLSAPILGSMNALGYVSVFSVLGALGVSIMTPIGGKLGDLIGRRNIVVIPGLLCAIFGFGIAFVRSLVPLLILRLLLSIAQGAFTAAPYIIVGLINEKQQIPKAMGFLAAAVAIGGFGGSIIAGVLSDMGMLTLALVVPAVPLLVGVLLIGLYLPNQKREDKVTIDVLGIAVFSLALCAILFPLSFGASLGWTDPLIIGSAVVGIISIILLIKVERNAEDPLIPLKLFGNKRYTILLLVGFSVYFYQAIMNTYVPIAAIQVLGTTAGVAGSLLVPRTIICMFLPAFAGTWVGKGKNRIRAALVISSLFVAIPMAILGLTTPNTSVLVFYSMLALTGIAEGFRSVSVTPAAQETLETGDIGIGTSLVNFSNSLAGTVGSALAGTAYGVYTAAASSDIYNIQKGCNAAFWVAAAVALVGLLIVVFF